MTRNLSLAISILALAAVYFISGKFGLSLAFINASVSSVWPPSGIALAALLLWGHRLWPGVFLGAFLVNITTQGMLATALGIALGNTLEAILGAWLVNRFAGGARAFRRIKDVLKFVLLAAILSTTVSATLGVTSLSLGGFTQWERYWIVWITWWLGDAIGDVIVAPLILIWLAQPLLPLKPKQVIEAAGIILATLSIGQLVFLGDGPFHFGPYPFAYVVTLPLLWAAFRFRQHGAVTCALVLSGIALWGTLQGFGPFARQNLDESLVFLQVFMGIITATALMVAAVISERERAEHRLQIQSAASRILTESADLSGAARKVMQVICERARWEVGALWDVDRGGGEMSCVEVWHLPAAAVPQFESITRRRKITRGNGLPGRVWETGKPEWVSDVRIYASSIRLPAMMAEGLRTAVCFPINSGGGTVGAIEFLSGELREADDDFLRMLDTIGNQLGQFMDRWRAEEALRASEERFQAILDQSTAVIYLKNLEGKYILINARYEGLFRISKQRIIGKTDFEIFPEAFARKFRDNDVKVIEAGIPMEFEETAPHADGWHTYISIKVPLRRDGTIYGVAGISTDITERKRAEQTSSQRTRSLEIINRVGNALAAELDLSKIVQSVTDAGREISGAEFGAFFYNAKDEQGESYQLYALSGAPREAFEKFPVPRNTALFEHTFQGRGVIRLGDVTRDFRYGKNPPHYGMPKGHLPVRSYLAVPVVSRSGAVIGGLFFGHPETNVFTAESENVITAIAAQAAIAIDNANLYQAVQRRVEEFQKLIDTAPVGIAVAMDPECRQIWGNPEFADMLGTDVKQNISKSGSGGDRLPFKMFRDGKEVPAEDLPMQRACREGREVLDEDLEIVRSDGKVVQELCRATPLRDEQGRVRGCIGVFLNISERKEAEEALRRTKDELARSNEILEKRVKERTAELERAHAALLRDMEEQKRLEEQLRHAQKMESIGTLAGGIAHDFNNILNIIKGYAAILGRSTSTVAESLKVIDETIDRGTSVVRQLLTLARKTEANLSSADANQIVSELIKLLKQTLPKNIDVALELSAWMPPIMADPRQISQALLNLCVNARDAMPNGGSLTLRTEAVDGQKVRERHADAGADQYVCIEVIDTGAGMDESIRNRIFEPFFTTKGIGEGTGLGLSIVYGIVKNHGGFIELESPSGRGTMFRLYLPAGAASEEASTEDDRAKRLSAGKFRNGTGTVLVAEDEEAMARLLENILSQRGYRVMVARDGEEAVDLYARHQREIDVVLLDIGLPKVAGWDVILRMKEENPAVKIIVASGYIDPQLKTKMYGAGVQDFVDKPYAPGRIIERLQTLIERT